MICVGAGLLHLWLVFLEEARDPLLLQRYRALLSDEELQQHARFHFERDRHCYLVTRALVRIVLSKYASIEPRDWRFAKNDYGRPYVVNDDVDARRLSFNLAHTRGLVVLAVTRDDAIGVDVENLRSGHAGVELAHRFFAPEEVAALAALPPEQQEQRFFEYWTLKESYIKARGMGLSIGLDMFAFDLRTAGAARLVVNPSLNDAAERWRFCMLQPGTDHLVALCSERRLCQPPLLTINVLVPWLHEETVQIPLCRSSDR